MSAELLTYTTNRSFGSLVFELAERGTGAGWVRNWRMSNAKLLQNESIVLLGDHFDDVQKEWSIYKDATDGFVRSRMRYSPKLDIAVGPFSTSPGVRKRRIETGLLEQAPSGLMELLERHRLSKNPNPSCALAIEIAFSGSRKHMLGDVANASLMGLYGVVLGNEKTLGPLKRIMTYLENVKQVGKAPKGMFKNVIVAASEEFMEVLGQ
jgi:hypothetical protein